MKFKRIHWRFVSLFALVTIAICLGAWPRRQARSAPNPLPTPPDQTQKRQRHFDHFPVADYNEELPANSAERDKRVKINHRYDGNPMVPSQPPRPEITGSYSIPEGIAPQPALPTAGSDLVVVGRVSATRAHLSNDKKAIYSEFCIDVTEVLKDDEKNSTEVGQSIGVDQPGGYVRYPNGQTYLLHFEGAGFPDLGDSVLLFLVSDRNSPNYQMLAGYELLDTSFLPLTPYLDLADIAGKSRTELLEATRQRVKSSLPEKSP
ncbi:MAG: hypothetical protein ACJ73D_08105 [Pyrinomonadaceae bacterium]